MDIRTQVTDNLENISTGFTNMLSHTEEWMAATCQGQRQADRSLEHVKKSTQGIYNLSNTVDSVGVAMEQIAGRIVEMQKNSREQVGQATLALTGSWNDRLKDGV